MDAIIVQDIRFEPKLHSLTEKDCVVATLQLNAKALGETDVALKDLTDNVWRPRGVFPIPVAEQTLSISIFVVDISQERSSWGSISVDVAQIAQISDRSKRQLSIQLERSDDNTPIAVIRFSTVMTSSNYSAKKMPPDAIELIKIMESDKIVALLTQICTSDSACINADLLLLHTIKDAVASLDEDALVKPNALVLLANIYVFRYDVYLKSVEELDFSEPMYIIYKHGLQQALVFLEEADLLALEDHPKRPFMRLSLSLCLQHFIAEAGNDFAASSVYIGKLVDVVPHIIGEEAKKLSLAQFLVVILERKYTQSNNVTDIDNTIAMLEQVIQLTTDITSRDASSLQLNMLLERHSKEHSLPSDIPIDLYRRLAVLRSVSNEHPQKPILLNHLGHAFFSQPEALSNRDLTHVAIDVYVEALSLIENVDAHPERSSLLNNFAAALQLRMKQDGAAADPEDSSRICDALEGAVRYCPENDPNRLSYLVNLGMFLLREPTSARNIALMEKGRTVFIDAIAVAHTSTVDQILALGKFGYVLFLRQSKGRRSHLSDNIRSLLTRFEDTITLIPDSHPSKSDFIYQVGTSFVFCSNSEKDAENLDRAITLFERSAHLQIENNPSDSWAYTHLGRAYLGRFTLFRDVDDLQKGIELLERWHLESESTGNSEEANTLDVLQTLNVLVCGLFTRFNACGNSLDDITQAISVLEDAASIASKARNVTSYLDTQFWYFPKQLEFFPNPSDLDVILGAVRDEVKRISDDQCSEASVILENLGVYLNIRVKALINIGGGAVDVVLDKLANDVQVLPDAYPKKATWLDAMGYFLFQTAKSGADLAHPISMLTQAIEMTLEGSKQHGSISDHLASAFLRRFHWQGNLSDINSAINTLEDAFHSSEWDDVKLRLLSNLANCLMDRYHRLGDVSDHNRSCLAMCTARDLAHSLGNPADAADLDSKIGVALMNRTAVSSKSGDLTESIQFYQTRIGRATSEANALDLCGLAVSVVNRFQVYNDIQDLHIAVELINAASTDSHDLEPINQAYVLNRHGLIHSICFVHFNDVEDIDKGIASLKAADELTPELHPSKPQRQLTLGWWLPVRFHLLGDDQDLEDAFSYLAACASSEISSVYEKFRAASIWARWIRMFQRGNLLAAYSLAIELLPQLASLGLSIPNRHVRLLGARDVLVDAVAAAIGDGEYGMAIEWLEIGRGIVWGQLYALRTPVADLQAAYPDLADQLQHLSEQLDQVTLHSVSEENSIEEYTPRYHDLAHERDEIIAKVRKLEGFSEFLRPRKLNDLLQAAQSGPVVIINISNSRCDALALMPGSQLIHIPLEQFSAADAVKMAGTLQGLLLRQGKVTSNGRGRLRQSLSKNRKIDPDIEFAEILSNLWTSLAKPVLDGLSIKTPSSENLPRLWWCLTGVLSFLPVHAAGMYRKRDTLGSKLSDFVVSSYIPSISSFLNIPSPRDASNPQFMTVSLPLESKLPEVVKEIDNIICIVRGYRTLNLQDSEATVQNVIAGMKTSNYVHFACHGIQVPSNPTESALLLASNSELPLYEIAALKLAHGELAFLSACQTATGDDLLPEESVHLAAGMLSAGYRSVIGTMWSICDEDAPVIAKEFYSHLFKNGDGPVDTTQSAYALDHAVKVLRAEGASRKSFFSWVPFVHFGI